MLRFRLSGVVALLPWCMVGCSSGDDGAGPSGDGGAADVAQDTVANQPQPTHAACTGMASACLSGTAATKGFTAVPHRMVANLFRVFPSGSAQPAATQIVAQDGTWAFSGLAAWAHYFVQVVGDFDLPDGGGASVPALVGPLAVPTTASGPAVNVEPVQLQVLETKAAGASLLVQWASAHLYDPASGAETTDGANVAVVVGGQATPMPWGKDNAGHPAYFVQFAMPPPAQPTYTITTSVGSTQSSWQLVAAPPSFDGTISAPLTGATVPSGQSLAVSWGAQPSADYELVELFSQSGTTYSSTYASPQPDGPDVTQETVPATALSMKGGYLLNVVFSKASCPPSADGCVYASSIAAANLTAN